MKYCLLSVLFLLKLYTTNHAQSVPVNLGSTIVETSTLFTSAELPWELKYGPDGFLWMTTREGVIYRVDPATGTSTTVLDYRANVWQSGEAGMLGMCFHPDFSNTPQLFVVYTYISGGVSRERLSHFSFDGTSLSAEQIIFDNGNILATSTHNGSRLLILADNSILMTTGDAQNGSNAPDLNSLNGKILRFNLDGTIPSDNPDPSSPVFTSGHRNPQGLMLHPNGKIYETEHGPDNNDEFQIIESGRNYGWPDVEGYCDNDFNSTEINFCNTHNVTEPLVSWNPAPGGTWAPNDLIWYTGSSIPEFENKILVVFLKTAKLRTIELNANGDGILSQQDYFTNQWGRLRDITTAPNGDIFIATNTAPFRIIRIRNSAVIPVTLSFFNSSCRNNKVLLKWRTLSEINTAYFKLYRSADGINYVLINQQPTSNATGNTGSEKDYGYEDNQGNAGNRMYYKLEIVDNDGRIQSFTTNSIGCKGAGRAFWITDNVRGGTARLNMRDGQANPLILSIYNLAGQKVEAIKVISGTDLPIRNYPPGIYIVQLSSSSGEVFLREKIIH